MDMVTVRVAKNRAREADGEMDGCLLPSFELLAVVLAPKFLSRYPLFFV